MPEVWTHLSADSGSDRCRDLAQGLPGLHRTTKGRDMTATTRRAAEGRRRVVFGEHGTPIATINPTRSTWLGSLLAECEHTHVYLLPDDPKAWLATDAACPRCRLLGLV